MVFALWMISLHEKISKFLTKDKMKQKPPTPSSYNGTVKGVEMKRPNLGAQPLRLRQKEGFL